MPVKALGDAAELARLRREIAELHDTIARRDGVIAGLQWLMRQSGVPEPRTPDGEPVWRDAGTHKPGNA